MTRRQLSFPVKVVNGVEWLDFTAHGIAHEFCGEVCKQKSDLSFGGGHRVRHYHFRKNVHWRAPDGTTIDISDLDPDSAPPRRQDALRR